MKTPRPRNPASQMAVGLFVIAIGLIFLLDNIGLLDLDFTLHLWPTALIFFGVLKILQTRTVSGSLVGAGLILFGGVTFLHEIGVITLGWRALWPLLLIIAGLSVVFKSDKGGGLIRGRSLPEDGTAAFDKGSDDAQLNITAIMGGFERRVTTPDFRGGEVTAIFGGCELDMRQSSINGVAVLNVFALFGGITIKVPADWTVELEGTPIMGGFEEKTIAPATPSKRLIVRGYAIMGGMEVRN
jgi:hypothetical protein